VENLSWGYSIFTVGPQPRGQGPSDADASEYSMPLFAFLFLNLYLCFINDQITAPRACKQLSSIILHKRCHLVVYNRSCSVPPTVPVHLYELGDAETLFANNQSYRNAVQLRPKAL